MIPLIDMLTDATNLAQGWLWAAFLVFLRVGAAMALLPAFGEHSVPQRIRLALGVCYTLVILPAVLDRTPPPQGTLPFATEVIAGLVIGIGLRLFVFALQIAGTLAAQSTSLSQLFGGQGNEPQPTMSHIFVMAGLALAVMAGLHVRIAELFIYSYDVMPFGAFPRGADVANWGVFRISAAFSLAFSMAAPFIAAALIYNIALGVINRAMPQLMVIFVGAPALTLGGLVLLAVASPLLLRLWLNTLNAYIDNPFAGVP
ncbi:flagellar biosynthetic protein FliR [Pseudorhodobacter sp.]|uniref:flagellar biosynthetic protein FliR n=1 Tax=Pseudorhodobacter sp. TaxID=1934400 RepID=UPI0039E3A00D